MKSESEVLIRLRGVIFLKEIRSTEYEEIYRVATRTQKKKECDGKNDDIKMIMTMGEYMTDKGKYSFNPQHSLVHIFDNSQDINIVGPTSVMQGQIRIWKTLSENNRLKLIMEIIKKICKIIIM
jgi:hypothetical protein